MNLKVSRFLSAVIEEMLTEWKCTKDPDSAVDPGWWVGFAENLKEEVIGVIQRRRRGDAPPTWHKWAEKALQFLSTG